MKEKKKFKVAVVGTQSLRSKEIKNVLNKKKIPFGNVDFFDPDVKEEFSKLTQFRGKPKVVHYPDEESLLSTDLVFLAADNRNNRKFGTMAKKKKFHAIELSEAFNKEEVPVIVAGVNDEIIVKEKPWLIANPNPVTIILSHLFHLVHEKIGILKAIAFILQPVSAFENDGIEELAGQSVALLNSSSLPKKVFRDQIAFNLLSHTEKPGKDGFCLAEKQMISEIKRVFKGREFPISLSLIQAPVFHTYSIMTFLEIRKKADIPKLEILFKGSEFFRFFSPRISCPVSCISVAGKDEIFIGQIKKEESFPNSFWIWMVADNLTRGSALNALEIAEKLFSASST